MKTLKGQVVSHKMAKTATVLVERRWTHPIYKKIIRSTKKYQVHDEIGVKVGTQVKIVSCRPISKTKRWKVAEVIKK